MTVGLRESQQYLHDHQAELMGGAGKAVLGKIMEHERAAAALRITSERAKRRLQSGEQTEFRPGAGVPADGSDGPATDR
jgi:hypothetical protein